MATKVSRIYDAIDNIVTQLDNLNFKVLQGNFFLLCINEKTHVTTFAYNTIFLTRWCNSYRHRSFFLATFIISIHHFEQAYLINNLYVSWFDYFDFLQHNLSNTLPYISYVITTNANRLLKHTPKKMRRLKWWRKKSSKKNSIYLIV